MNFDKEKTDATIKHDGSYDTHNIYNTVGLESRENERIMAMADIEHLQNLIREARDAMDMNEAMWGKEEATVANIEIQDKITSWGDEILRLTDYETWLLGRRFLAGYR